MELPSPFSKFSFCVTDLRCQGLTVEAAISSDYDRENQKRGAEEGNFSSNSTTQQLVAFLGKDP